MNFSHEHLPALADVLTAQRNSAMDELARVLAMNLVLKNEVSLLKQEEKARLKAADMACQQGVNGAWHENEKGIK